MRILILTQFYAPEPAFKFADLARGLAERGHQVQVITGFPCFPTGKTYDGYRQRLYFEERLDGVQVTRVPQFPDHSRSALRRAVYYFSFALAAATIGLFRARPADIVLVYQSAFPVGLAAWVISRVKRIPYVLDVVDLWPESVAATGVQNRLVISTIRRLVQFIYNGARRINVITDGYWNSLTALGVSPNKLSLIHCWPKKGQFDPVPYEPRLAAKEGFAGRFNVVFAGAMGPVQGLRTVIEAAALLKDLGDVRFVMIGDGTERADLEALAEREGTANVRFLGRRLPAEVQQFYSMSDVLLVHLKPDPMSSISIPSKTFAYMASGRPILMAVEGEAGRLIEKHRCGLAIPPSDPQALAAAVRRFFTMAPGRRQEMAEAALSAYRNNYHSDLQCAKFESLLQQSVLAYERRAARRAA